MNSVAMDCPSYISTDGAATVDQVKAIVEAGANNLYGANSGGGSYANTLSGVVNGTAEAAATPTAIPATYNADGFFEETTYIGAVSGVTDNWYKGWTVPGSIKLN